MSDDRKADVREQVIGTLNGMGSHFFHRSLTLTTAEEARYAAGLWPGKATISTDRLTVTFRP